MFTVELFKKAMNLLNEKSEYASQCDEYFENHPMDEDAEAAFDKAWEEENRAFVWAAEVLSHLINIDERTARTMIRTKGNEIMKTLERVA